MHHCFSVVTKILFLHIICFCFSKNVAAQKNIVDAVISFPMIGATFAYQLPAGDLAERFGNNFNTGGVFQWKFKSNLILGIEGNFLFSDEVKEKYFLDSFKTPDGNIIDGNGKYASVLLFERGLNLAIKGGKIFPVIGPNKNSGLMTTIGVGYLHHKIRIETPETTIPYLEEEYSKGYDRFTSGVSVTEFIGYINFGNKRLINFYSGFEFTQAFTKNRRNLNFDTGLKDDKSRIDLLFGIRIGWIFPIYKRAAENLYIN